MGHSTSSFSAVYFSTNQRAQLQTLASDWMTKYMNEKLILQDTLVKMFPSLCKTPTNNSFKGTTLPSHIVTFLYQVIVIVLHAIWPKSENVKRIFSSI